RGFEFDRRWMLVDEKNEFITQRQYPQMALLQVELQPGRLKVFHKTNNSEIIIPFLPETGKTVMVQVWSNRCRAQLVSLSADNWFTEMLSVKCRLVYMPDTTRRQVDGRYATNKELTAFSDGYPFLLIGQASLDDLNSRLEKPLSIDRFRPNIVFTGGAPFQEDTMKQFIVNGIPFYGVKLCARCVITTIDQLNATKAKEPLKTLATYRMKNNKIFFGQNLLHKGLGTIHVGDIITL
ncbi:MAG: MOSC domain-containing protein, partial [Sphingobacteriales bacterium]|nr:MOSC domain-containing protein [Sphingobacteriales bacterium]